MSSVYAAFLALPTKKVWSEEQTKQTRILKELLNTDIGTYLYPFGYYLFLCPGYNAGHDTWLVCFPIDGTTDQNS